MLVVAAMASVSRVYGAEASSAGTSATILCAIALDSAGVPLHDALVRGGLVLVGGAWAMTLSLVLWPVRVYRPARLAVARCFRDLADHAADIERLLDDPGSESWQADVVRARGKIRDSVEAARTILAGTRRGARGESGRGARLLVLFHVADQIFARMGALGEVLEAAHAAGGSDEGIVVHEELEALRASLDVTADRIEVEERVEPLSLRVVRETDLRAADPDYAHAATPPSDRRSSIRPPTSRRRCDDRAPKSVPGLQAAARRRRDQLAARSAPRRVRAGVGRVAARASVASLAVALTHHFTLPRGYWVTITAIAVLQPHTPETFLKATQRIAGTVARAWWRQWRRRCTITRHHAPDARPRDGERVGDSAQLRALLVLPDADVRAVGGAERRRLDAREVARLEHAARRRAGARGGADLPAVAGARPVSAADGGRAAGASRVGRCGDVGGDRRRRAAGERRRVQQRGGVVQSPPRRVAR